MFYEKAIVENYAKIQSILLNTVIDLRLANLLIKKLQQRCFSEDFAKVFRAQMNGCFFANFFVLIQNGDNVRCARAFSSSSSTNSLCNFNAEEDDCRCSSNNVFLNILQYSQGKHLCWSLVLTL